MATKQQKDIKSKSWFFKIKAKFSAFFTELKAAFSKFFTFLDEDEDEDEDDEVPSSTTARKAVETEATATAASAYQEECNQAVIEAAPGTNFTVSEAELAILEVETSICREAYKALQQPLVAAYIKNNGLPDQDASVKASHLLENSKEKLAFNQALKARKILEDKHIKAFTEAINKHGKGKLLRLNGFCLERLQDVGGINNNCGANVMLHVFLENWDHLNFQDKHTKSLCRDLLRAAQKNNATVNINTIPELKAYIDSFSFTQQEKIFTPGVRMNLGKTLQRSKDYFKYFVAQGALGPLDENLLIDKEARKLSHGIDYAWDPVLFGSREYNSYSQYRLTSPKTSADKKLAALNKTSTFIKASPSTQEKMKKEIEDKRKEAQLEKEDLEKALFKNRYDRLGDEHNAMQISEDELNHYARIMGINLNVYTKNRSIITPRVLPDDPNHNLIQVNIVNLSASHWMYERNRDYPADGPAPIVPPNKKGTGPKVPPPAKPKKDQASASPAKSSLQK